MVLWMWPFLQSVDSSTAGDLSRLLQPRKGLRMKRMGQRRRGGRLGEGRMLWCWHPTSFPPCLPSCPALFRLSGLHEKLRKPVPYNSSWLVSVSVPTGSGPGSLEAGSKTDSGSLSLPTFPGLTCFPPQAPSGGKSTEGRHGGTLETLDQPSPAHKGSGEG